MTTLQTLDGRPLTWEQLWIEYHRWYWSGRTETTVICRYPSCQRFATANDRCPKHQESS